MTTPRVGINVRVELQETLGSPITITNITRTNPAVVTAAGSAFANGDVVVLTVPQGMDELDKQSARVKNAASGSFELEGIDATSFPPFIADDGNSPPANLCTVRKVTAFVTYANSTSISRPNATPTKLDATTLLDRVRKKYVFGLQDSAEGTISTIYQPTATAERLIKRASIDKTTMVFRVTWPEGQKQIFNAYVSGGDGFTQAGNAVATGTTSFTCIDEPNDFDS